MDPPSAPRTAGKVATSNERKNSHASEIARRNGGKADDRHASHPNPSYFALAEHWAPVWYHDTDKQEPRADLIIPFDFDGDTRSNNNWENLNNAGVDLRPVVYYSVTETESHYFLLYGIFHARDWDHVCKSLFNTGFCHENDFEGAMLVIRKLDDNPVGTFETLYVQSHNNLHIYSNDDDVSARSSKRFESVPVTFENDTHPELYVESKGHGVCALYHTEWIYCKHPIGTQPIDVFSDGDGIVYRYKAGISDIPNGVLDFDVDYALIPLETTLWPRRFDICDGGNCTFDTTMTYNGVTLSKQFDGDNYLNDRANPPWAWDDDKDGPNVLRGDFFFDPARTYELNVNSPYWVSRDYLYNRYLSDLQP